MQVHLVRHRLGDGGARRAMCARLSCGSCAETLELVEPGRRLEVATVRAGMLQLAAQVGAPGVLHLTPAAVFCMAYLVEEQELQQGFNLVEFQNLVDQIHSSLVFLAVIYTCGHYSLVICTRSSLAVPWDIWYGDSVPRQSPQCHMVATRLLTMLDFLEPDQVVPASDPGSQGEEWASGLWCLAALERELARLAGVPLPPVLDLLALAGRLNSFIRVLQLCTWTYLGSC